MNKTAVKIIIFLTASVILGGCAVAFKSFDKPQKQFYYINPNKDIKSLGRVALIEMSNSSNYPRMSFDVTQSFYNELLKTQIFGIIPIYQNDPEWKNVQIQDGSEYSLEHLKYLRNELQCDAIIVGSVIDYRPYPHQTIGLRMKMIDLRDAEVIWGMEQVWDCADKSVQNRISSYYSRQKGIKKGPLNEQLLSLSSIEFLKFVSYEIADTFQ